MSKPRSDQISQTANTNPPGSSHLMTVSGGPAPWVTDKSGYIEELEGVEDGFSAGLVSRNKGAAGVVHSFRVTCLLLGEQVYHTHI